MKKRTKHQILLEPLEERIFFDANPASAVVEPVDDGVESQRQDGAAMQAEAEKLQAEDETHLTDETVVETTDSVVAGDAVEVDTGEVLPQETVLEAQSPGEIEPIDPMLGEDFTFTVTFDNTESNTVYGPYIDLIFDRGLEGAEVGDDGLSFVSASYLGSNVQSDTQIVDINGEITHAWATDAGGSPLVVSGLTTGDEFVTLLLPVGSFTTTQTAAEVEVTAHMSDKADVNVALDVDVVTGARFGVTPEDDPGSDPPLREIETSALAFLPEVISFETDINVPGVASDSQDDQFHDPIYDDVRNVESNHQEIPTGSHFPAEYISTINIADGLVVDGPTTGLIYTQHVPDSVYYLGVNSVVDSDGTAVAYTILQAPTGAGGGDLSLQLDNAVTGTDRDNDVVITYGFYVPEQTGGGSPADIIDPATGDEAHIVNDGEITYSWSPLDSGNDTPVTATIDAEVDSDGNFSDNPSVDDISHAESLSIQKSHELKDNNDLGYASYSPGDIVDFTLDFQVSDYFSFGDAVPGDSDYSFRVDDTVGNGLLVDESSISITIVEGAVSNTLALTVGNVGDRLWKEDGSNGDVVYHYNLHAILQAMGGDGILDGGDVLAASNATVGEITYQATIQTSYATGYVDPSGGGDFDVDQEEVIGGGVEIVADVYDRSTTSFTGNSEADSSSDNLTIAIPVQKEIYAINGDTDSAEWEVDENDRPRVSAGDTVSYRVSYEVPLDSIVDFSIIDNFPVSVFDADDPTFDGSSAWSHTGTTVSLTAGTWYFTGAHTFEGTLDSFSASDVDNSLTVNWNDYIDLEGSMGSIDLVLSLKVSGEPLADDLLVANQVTVSEDSDEISSTDGNDIVPIVLEEPVLAVTKGIVEVADTGDTYGTFETNNDVDTFFSEPADTNFRFTANGGNLTSEWLAANNIDTNLLEVDGQDIITVAIVVENRGHGDAYDVVLSDALGTGFEVNDVSNFQVKYGDGTAVNYTGTLADFFSTGITLDNSSNGIITGLDIDQNSGADILTNTDNIVVITYDLTLDHTTVGPDQVINNSATVESFTSIAGSLTPHASVSDAATTELKDIVVDKTGTPTSVTIGETVQYQVEITLPEGTAEDFVFTDTVAAGFEILTLDSITLSDGATVTAANDTDGAGNGTVVLTGANEDIQSNSITLTFGDIVNNASSNSTDETLTISYTVRVLNIDDNDIGDTLSNSAIADWKDSGGTDQSSTDTLDVTLLEPQITTTKLVGGLDTLTGVEAGDSLTYTVKFENTGDATAFETAAVDNIAQGTEFTGVTTVEYFTYVSPGVYNSSDITGASTAPGNSTSTVAFGSNDGASWDIASKDYILVTYTATVLQGAVIGDDHTNTVDADWTGLNGDQSAIERNYNDSADESDTDNVDRTQDSDTATFLMTPVTVDIVDDQADDEATIGDDINYTVTIDPPKGQVNSFVVRNVIPAGMIFNNTGDLYLSGFDQTGSSNPANANATIIAGINDGVGGVTVEWDFGNVDIDGDADIVLSYSTTVANVLNNADSVDKDNAVTVTYVKSNSDVESISDTVTVSIIEPIIETTKVISGTVDGGITRVEIGGIITYEVTFLNSGGSDAFEVTALDTLAPGASYFTDGSHTPTATTGGIAITDNNDGTLTITSSADGWDIPVGSSVTISYHALVGADYFDSSYGQNTTNNTNSIDADWSHRDGDLGAGERIYEDGGTPWTVDGNQDTEDAEYDLNYGGSIGDIVFFDGNNNNTFDGDDVGISGVDVTITADFGGDGVDFTRTVRTDSDGNFLFANLAAFDNYNITVNSDTTAPAGGGEEEPLSLDDNGFAQTYDVDGGLDHTASVDLNAGVAYGDADFGYTGSQSLGSLVWYDGDGDGVQPGTDTNEAGIGGYWVKLAADIDGDGDFEYVTSIQTANDGTYEFVNLPGMKYTVMLDPYPTGHVDTYDLDGGNDHTTEELTLPASGGSRDDIDFGVRGDAQLGNIIFFDGDNNNAFNGDDVGIKDVDVTLSVDIDGDSIADYTSTTTTAADGSYSFTDLIPGTYTISVDESSLPLGMVQSYDPGGLASLDGTHDQLLAAGGNINSVDFGYTGDNSIGDVVWYDVNGNGVQNSGEGGIGGLTVTLQADLDGDGSYEYSTTDITDAAGSYLFVNLPASALIVSVAPPSASMATYDKDSGTGSPDNSSSMTVGADEDVNDIDFGIRGTTGSISDTVFFDVDGDGGSYGTGQDEALPGVVVSISGDVDGDGLEDYTATVSTDGNGNYSFDNLLGGEYTISVNTASLPQGMAQTYDLDGIASANTIENITLNPGQVRDDFDFGYTGTGSLADTVFFDSDNDSGVQGTGVDVGITGVTVTLGYDIDDDGTVDFTVTDVTDGAGLYSFARLFAGTYTVTVDSSSLPIGYAPTYDLDANQDHTAKATLTAGQARSDVDFGYTGSQTGGNFVWYDGDGNAVFDSYEDGLGGITVNIDGDIDGDGDAEYHDSTVSADDGSYLFNNLPSGSYTISLDSFPGLVATYDVDGDNNNSTSFNILTGTGGDRDDIDFGIRGDAQLGDRLFFDFDSDGVQDELANDYGIADATITLSVDIDGDGSSDFTYSQITDANGEYSFTQLLPGTYTIVVDEASLPPGMFQTMDPGGSTSLDGSHDQTLIAGDDIATVDFGYTGTGTIGDFVWWDSNGDGLFDSGEIGLAGVAVQLSGDFDGDDDTSPEIIATVFSDDSGNFLFENLPSANGYIITIMSGILDGAVPTYDFDGTAPSGDPQTNYDLGYDEFSGRAKDEERIDFGFVGTGTIGSTVWNDLNNDGLFSGESGLSGVKVTLSADLDGNPGNGEEFVLITTTDSSGEYSFENLITSSSGIDYTITVDPSTLPLSAVPTYDFDGTSSAHVAITTLTNGSPADEEIDFGYQVLSTVGNRVWLDIDGDGAQGSGENGLAGITVTLYDSGGVQLDTRVTDDTGNYLFNNLAAGTYRVDVTDLPDGLLQTYDADGLGTVDSATVVLGDGEDLLDVDFGYLGSGSIGDTVWNDLDGDSTDNSGSEPGIGGVTVTLVGDLNNDGDTTDTEDSRTINTNADGYYSFTGLFAGNYEITLTNIPLNMQPTYDPEGVAGDARADVTLSSGNLSADGVDFGYEQVGAGADDVAKIGDRVWFDSNGDGVEDTGEFGISGVTVTLFDADTDTQLEQMITDSNGNYLFVNILPGNYYVTVDDSGLPTGMVQTWDRDDTDPAGTFLTPHRTGDIALVAQGDTLDADFGYRGEGSIGDTIWQDIDGDKTDNGGSEPGISGVEVTLQGDFNGDGDSSDTMTRVTDVNGKYLFDNLFDGEYSVIVDESTLPAGISRQTYDPDDPAGVDPRIPNDGQTTVTLGGGNPLNVDSADFGYTASGFVGDTLWYDIDADGIYDADELALEGVRVVLTGYLDEDGDLDSIAQITDENGNYLFEGLPAGDYTITVDKTTLPAVMVGTYDSDGYLATPDMSIVTLSSDGIEAGQDFGYRGTGSIGDLVWYDLDADGLYDSGEFGIAGAKVTLTADLNFDGELDSLVTFTGSDGKYLFANLVATDFTITVDPLTLPDAMIQSFDIDGIGSANSVNDITLNSGQVRSDVDFGYLGIGSIGGVIWNDLDGDNTKNFGSEPGIDGVTVTLVGDLNNDGDTTDPEDTRTVNTAADGQYSFTGLFAGNYEITLTNIPLNMQPTYDPEGVSGDARADVILSSSGNLNVDALDFGYEQVDDVAKIGDRVWFDTDGDGVDDVSESGISGVTVTLFDADTDVQLEQVSTDINGNYLFVNLLPGNYYVTVDESGLPTGMVQTWDRDDTDSTGSFLTPHRTGDITLIGLDDIFDADFGYRASYKASGFVGDTIWYDIDADGNYDAGELALEGVRVVLTGYLDEDGDLDSIAQITDENGNYLFEGLPAGDYTVTVDKTTLPAVMVGTYDSDGYLTTPDMSIVTLGSDGAESGQDFGYRGTGSIGDVVWYDLDADGVYDSGEFGIAGAQVTLTADLNFDGELDSLVTFTDSDGKYRFSNLVATDFTITVDPLTLPGVMVQTFDMDGGMVSQDSSFLSLATGEQNIHQDFGYTGTGTIGNQLWYDLNGDGIYAGTEQGIEGVEVILQADMDGDGAEEILSAVTDSSGHYLFENLINGQYSLTINELTLPGKLEQTYDSDGTSFSPHSSTVNLGVGENSLTQDFGYDWQVPTISPIVVADSIDFNYDILLQRYLGLRGETAVDYFMTSHGQRDTIFLEPLLPVSPMYSGQAEPGATIQLNIYDSSGNNVGTQVVMADSGGNWLANFSGSLLYDVPHLIDIVKDMSPYNQVGFGGYDLHGYFGATFGSAPFSSFSMTLDSVFANLPSSILESFAKYYSQPNSLEWYGFYNCEPVVSSTDSDQNAL